MKLATWNVNSLKVRLPQPLPWLSARAPGVVCLQETKTEDADFPVDEIRAAGYQPLFTGQKAYNGVAILSRTPPSEVVTALPGFVDEQKRVLAATVDDVRVICVYVPNGESIESEKYQYKLRWLDALHGLLREELNRHPQLVLLGDYNIAPEDRDVQTRGCGRARCCSANRRRPRFAAFWAWG